jgi:dipeptidase E
MKRQRHIIALGGGGFSRLNNDARLCSYIFEQTGRTRPKVLFIPTASGDDPAGAVAHFTKAAKRLGAKPSHLSLFTQPLEPLRTFVGRYDAIYVSGGNTRNMLLLWRAWGLDVALHEAYKRGIVLAGSSAGALCWFRSGLTDSWTGSYRELACLGWLRGSFCPHFDSEPKRKPIYRRLVRMGVLPSGYAADDNVALHFIDEHLAHIVSSRPKARARKLVRSTTGLMESELKPELL